MFVLLGSQNFSLLENISQSLAGRTAIFHLLPFSILETEAFDLPLNRHLLMGGYPRIYDQEIDPSLWADSYIRTYVERDVRSIKNVNNLGQFL
jgi:uncharacterized protein